MMKIINEQILDNFKTKNNGKLNLAIFSDCYYPLVGGITLRVYNQAKALSKFCNVVVVTGNVAKYKDEENLPFAIIRCKGLKISDYQGNLALPSFDYKYKKLLKSLNIDVIHLHTYFFMAKSAYRLKKKLNIPIIQISHQRLYPEYVNVVKNKLLAKILTNYSIKMIDKADDLWTVSQNVLDFYRESKITKDITIDPSGSDRTYPENAKELISFVNDKYNIKPDEKVLIALSRMEMKQKNLDFLLNSVALAKKKGFQNFKLFMVGKGKDLETLKAMAKNLQLDEVVFTGFVDNDIATGLYLRSDLHLFPSIFDNFGLTKVEAASLHTPTLAIEGTAVVETITDGYNGYISSLTEDDYSNKIIEIFSNQNILKEVSENAQKTMGKTWDDLAKTTYENTLKIANKYKNTKEKQKVKNQYIKYKKTKVQKERPIKI